MRGHTLHVTRKMKENNGKMKKLEASLLKMLVRISSWLLISSVLELSFSLSLSISLSLSHTRGHLDFSWRTFGEVFYTGNFLARRQRKRRKEKEYMGISNYNGFFLHVTSCMYVFLTIFGMHGIRMWSLDNDMSLAWRIAWIDNGFS